MSAIIQRIFADRRCIIGLILSLLTAYLAARYSDHLSVLIFSQAGSIDGNTKMALNAIGMLRVAGNIIIAMFCGISLLIVIRDVRQCGAKDVPLVIAALLIVVCVQSAYSEYERGHLVERSYRAHLHLMEFEKKLLVKSQSSEMTSNVMTQGNLNIDNSRNLYLDRYAIVERIYISIALFAWSLAGMGPVLYCLLLVK